jgi:hypothetical protein
MQIQGIEGLTADEVHRELDAGAKFVVFQYAISVLILTFRRSSAVYFIRAGESPIAKGLPYTLLSVFLGWWGFPWGLIYTPMALATNLTGGKDVTREIRSAMAPRPPVARRGVAP